MAVDGNGQTALHWAALMVNEQIIMWVLNFAGHLFITYKGSTYIVYHCLAEQS